MLSCLFNEKVLAKLAGMNPSLAQVRQALREGGERADNFETDRYAHEAYSRNLQAVSRLLKHGAPGTGKSY